MTAKASRTRNRMINLLWRGIISLWNALIVVRGRLLQFGIGDDVMLNPERRPFFLQESFELGVGLHLHLGIPEVRKRREVLQSALRRVVIEITAQKYRSSRGEFQKQRLVAGSVSRRRDDYDASIAEHVVVSVEKHGLTGFEGAESQDRKSTRLYSSHS